MIYYLQRYVCLIFATFLCFTMLISISHAANNDAGTVLLTKGKVTVRRDSSNIILKRGDPLFAQDELQVGANGRVQFRTKDNAVISLQGNSVFKIHQYSYKQSKQKDKASYELLSGGLRTVTGAIGKGNKKTYELKTPLATIGIRGTLFEVEIVGNETFIVVREGAVYTRSSIDGCDLSLSAGQFLHITVTECRVLQENQLPTNLSLFATGHSSTVKTINPTDSINLDIIKNSQEGILLDLDEISRQEGIIADFIATIPVIDNTSNDSDSDVNDGSSAGSDAGSGGNDAGSGGNDAGSGGNDAGSGGNDSV